MLALAKWVAEGSCFAVPWPNSVKLELQIHQSCGLLSQMLEEKVKMTGFISPMRRG